MNLPPVSPDGIVVATLILLPASPVSEAVRFTTPLPPLVAATPTAVPVVIAVMMFVASCAGVAAAAPDHHWKFGLVLEPSDPAVVVVIVRFVVPVCVGVPNPVLPGILAVMFTLGLLAAAVTPPAGWLAPLAHSQVVLVPPLPVCQSPQPDHQA